MQPPEHATTRAGIRSLRDSLSKGEDKKGDIDIAQAVANSIVQNEKKNGSRFLLVDELPRLFSAVTRKLMEISVNDRHWNAYLCAVYGINAKDKIASAVTTFVDAHARWYGERREVRRWVAFQNGALHISNYNGSTWRITGSGVVIDDEGWVVDDGWRPEDSTGTLPPIGIGLGSNGDEVVFADDDEGKPVLDPKVGRYGLLFKLLGSITWAGATDVNRRAGTPGGMLPKHQTLAMVIWMFAVAFPDLFPTKPLLILEGAAGGGKSTAMQMIQAALHGCIQPVIVSENGEKDFRVSLLRSPIAVLDNTDDFIKWLPNALAAYATGAGWSDRQLYTNQGIVKLRPQAFVAVASKNPVSFRQDDVADRSIILRTERRKDALDRRYAKRKTNDVTTTKASRRMSAIFADIAANRELIYGEWLYYLNRIVAVINNGGLPETAEHRMADWEAFCWAVARAFNWPDRLINDLLRALQGERTSFAAENDVVVDLLEQWLGEKGNDGRRVEAAQLYKELRMLAEYDNKPFLKSALALAHRLRAPHVADRFFIDADTVGGKRVYQIARWLDEGVSN